MKPYYRIKSYPVCDSRAVVRGKCYRFTILTPYLIRLEYSADGVFEDRPTQTVLNRLFAVPEYEMIRKSSQLTLQTKGLRLVYDVEAPFAAGSLHIQVRGNLSDYRSVWHYGDPVNDLGGTARTLDGADGPVSLEHGLMSYFGYSVLDDSKTMVLTEDGWVAPRENIGKDLYFFGYGRDYEGCLRDFYRLSGPVPLLPRWALGNWWSRYHKYTQQEYEELMLRFERECVPLSVAVIDMDWHLVDIDPKYGSGWTGYTWNTKLFPDPPVFLKWLHERGLHVTLNVHPAEGVRAFEKAYPAMAKALGANVQSEEPLSFDPADSRYMEAYFKYLHHPLEKEGVDFWWVDWQQGSVSRIPGLDPLWILNHFHFLDNGRGGGRPLTFSRYAGPGSHRYPVGFSGDSIISWKSLAFQPYFTASASNIGYGWWSHDIGGHMGGVRDDELAARWVQFGVFSPIMRLHSSANPFTSKEPWRFSRASEAVMKHFLRLRHRMLPYLYTMNRAASLEGVPLLRPMYYHDPEREEAYRAPNEYLFGTELIAAPITEPMDRSLCMGKAAAWLPKGKWIDFFTGTVYDGERMLALWRPLEEMPLLAKAGAILPLAEAEAPADKNPEKLELHIYGGADGLFTLWENDGEGSETEESRWVKTVYTLQWGEKPRFVISPAEGQLSAVPPLRQYALKFRALTDADVEIFAGEKPVRFEKAYSAEERTLTVVLPKLPVTEKIEAVFVSKSTLAPNNLQEAAYRLLDRAQISYNLKTRIYAAVKKQGACALGTLFAMELPAPLLEALGELLTAQTPDTILKTGE